MVASQCLETTKHSSPYPFPLFVSETEDDVFISEYYQEYLSIQCLVNRWYNHFQKAEEELWKRGNQWNKRCSKLEVACFLLRFLGICPVMSHLKSEHPCFHLFTSNKNKLKKKKISKGQKKWQFPHLNEDPEAQRSEVICWTQHSFLSTCLYLPSKAASSKCWPSLGRSLRPRTGLWDSAS